jgi:hypothetical protein
VSLLATALLSMASVYAHPFHEAMKTGLTNVAPNGNMHEAPSFEDITIYRIQLRILTCNNEDAGTDDGVYVQMNERDEKFFLDKSTDDFRKGLSRTYDILSETVNKIKDVNFLKIGIRGDDGTCIRAIQLFLNDNKSPVFEKSYSGLGNWIDNSQSFTVTESELRKNSGWRYTSKHKDLWKPPNEVSKDMILSLVECSIGNQLNHQSDFSWGKERIVFSTLFGPAVEVTFVDYKTLHFDLDLERELGGPNPEVDVDFDLVFTCTDGVIQTKIKDLKVETDKIYQFQKCSRDDGMKFVTKAIGTYPGETETSAIFGGAVSKYLSFKINFDSQDPNVSSSCKSINVKPDGDIVLDHNQRDHRTTIK